METGEVWERGAVIAEEGNLVQRARSEPAAFSQLYESYFPRVYNYVRNRVRESDTADDLTAIVFERAWDRLDRYVPHRAPFAAWLFGIARHVVEDHFRALKRRRWLPLEALFDHPSAGAAPEEQVVRNETRSLLYLALEGLNERERDLVALKFASGLDNRQIASLTGLSESNVGTILYRAMQQIRSTIKEQEHE